MAEIKNAKRKMANLVILQQLELKVIQVCLQLLKD